jgi:hypothetical protein
MEFKPFPKVSRLSREVVITEKIDGTNASVWIESGKWGLQPNHERWYMNIDVGDDWNPLRISAASRSRFISPTDDNFGFSKWVQANAAELVKLGEGIHFGEWWGSGIQRGYGLPKGEKRFSLFNTHRWGEERPACCHVVPELARGAFDSGLIDDVLFALGETGSYAAPGFMRPEGVMIYHTAANIIFKKTFEGDEKGKGQ